MTRNPKLHDAMAYICNRYPFPDDLSNARLTKLLYLADWVKAQVDGEQVTDIRWYFNHYGPYVDDVRMMARTSKDFEVDSAVNAFGSLKETIRARGQLSWDRLTERDTAAIDLAMSKTRHMTFTEFLRAVYATYPVRVSERYDFLPLVELARGRARKARDAASD